MSLADLSIYFKPVKVSNDELAEEAVGTKVILNSGDFPEVEKNSIVIFDCPEFRNYKSETAITSSNRFRSYFYKMMTPEAWSFPIYDLGTILPGERVEDTYYAISAVVSELVKNNCLPILIGGSQDLMFGVYQGYQKLEQTVNFTNIDSSLDLGNPEDAIDDSNYLSHILTTRPCTLFNYSIIGTQQPFMSTSDVKLIDKLYFDYCRLGELVGDFKKAEPLIRNSDIIAFDLKSLKYMGEKCSFYDNPNGIAPEMACQISKYAGISDRSSCFAITNYFSGLTSEQFDHLVAQMMWYFIDGYSARYGDFPISSLKGYMKFTVNMVDIGEEIVFYKSEKSERWWMEVPYPKKKELDFKRHTVVPCNYEDYEQAMRNDIPNLWWKTFQKLL